MEQVPYKTLDTPTGAQSHNQRSSGTKRLATRTPCFGAPFIKRVRPSRQPPCARGYVTSWQQQQPPVEEVVRGRAEAAAVQAAILAEARERQRAGRSGSVGKRDAPVIQRPCVGSLLLRKRTERARRLTWRAASRGLPPARHPRNTLLCFGMKESVIDVTSQNAHEFKFIAWEFYSPKLCKENIGGIPVGDGATLLLDEEGKAGVSEVTRAFLTSSGVDPNLVPSGWVENHFRWLVWKLAATERSYPHLFAGRCLNPNVLFLQLKYRYDREIDLCQRPALRRIVEKDDSAAKRLVLCVADILPVVVSNLKKNSGEHQSVGDAANEDKKSFGFSKVPSSDCELLLTDGWYSIRTVIDSEMCHIVHNGRVSIGTKLVTHGAELLNCEEGCHPLEMSPITRLKIHTNSTRRARWDVRLGFQSDARPIPIHLNSILPHGGFVSCVCVITVRIYPAIYIEKLPNGKSVTHSERVEIRKSAHFEQQRQRRLEQLYSQERAQFSQEKCSKSHVTAQKLRSITSGQELCELLDRDCDPSSLQSLLTEEQCDTVREFQQNYREQIFRELQSRVQRRIQEEDALSRSVTCVRKIRCLDVKSKDGSKTAILSIWRPSEDILQHLREGSMFKIFGITANGMRLENLQLSTGRQTRYHQIPLSRPPAYFPRRLSSIGEILSKNFQTPFNELDTVGIVVDISVAPKGASQVQTVYVADADMNLIGITFWGGIKEFGWEDLLKKTSFIAAVNLQWRANSQKQKITCIYATEFSTFSLNPRYEHLKNGLENLRQNIQMDLNQFCLTCEELIIDRLNRSFHHDTVTEGVTMNSNTHFQKHTSNMEENIDTEDNLVTTPNREKLRKLEQYANPPPVSPLYLPCNVLKKKFKLPSRTSPIMAAVQNMEKSCDSESPPLSLDDPD